MEDIEKRDCFKNHRTGKKRITENSMGEEECVCCWGVKQHKSLHQTDGAQTSWEESKPGSMKQTTAPHVWTPVSHPDFLPPTALNWHTRKAFESQETDRELNT